MIDHLSYRAAESIASSDVSLQQAYVPASFRGDGNIPTRVESIQDLRHMLDTMQEHRFDGYMQEIHGLSDDEHKSIRAQIDLLTEMQIIHFPDHTPIKPLDTIMSAWALWKKLTVARPNAKTILEIGPGCGYLSCFLAANSNVTNYTQIESCESFYLLQSMVNAMSFGARIWEAALENKCGDQTVWHLPWWRVREILPAYDVITANACLCEFTDRAFSDYVNLFDQCATPDTLLLVQCTGAHHFRGAEQLYETLQAHGWRKHTTSDSPVHTWWLTKGEHSIVKPSKNHNSRIMGREEF